MSKLENVDAHVVELIEAALLGHIARQQEALGLTNAELAQRAGVNRMTIQRAREDHTTPRVPNLIAMALAVGLTPTLIASGEEAVSQHEARMVHRGLHHNRTKRDPDWRDTQREKALATAWEAWNKYTEVGSSPVMRSLVPSYDQTHASAVATAVQWLGSDVGFDFLKQALGAAGYDIVERTRKRTSQSR
jgi:transcriptional regulator with XRE-family HTH domain